MSPEDVKQKVLDEIGGDWAHTNPHHVDLRTCLLPKPIRKPFENSWFDPKRPEGEQNRRLKELWLVLEEDPTEKKGYEIVYDEKSNRFGLANGGTFIGFYGNFFETLDGM